MGYRLLLPFGFFFQAEDGIRDDLVTGVQTCALPIWFSAGHCSPTTPTGVFRKRVWPGPLCWRSGGRRPGRRIRSEERRVGKEWRSRRGGEYRRKRRRERGG